MDGREKRRLDDQSLGSVSGGAAENPGKQKIGYNVKRGDTLTRIAALYGVSVLDLVSWNDIRNPDLIRVGDVIAIYK